VYLYIYLPLAYIPKPIGKSDTNPRFHQCLFSYQGEAVFNVPCKMYNDGRICQIHQAWERDLWDDVLPVQMSRALSREPQRFPFVLSSHDSWLYDRHRILPSSRVLAAFRRHMTSGGWRQSVKLSFVLTSNGDQRIFWHGHCPRLLNNWQQRAWSTGSRLQTASTILKLTTHYVPPGPKRLKREANHPISSSSNIESECIIIPSLKLLNWR
jgi:hypothetical protein